MDGMRLAPCCFSGDDAGGMGFMALCGTVHTRGERERTQMHRLTDYVAVPNSEAATAAPAHERDQNRTRTLHSARPCPLENPEPRLPRTILTSAVKSYCSQRLTPLSLLCCSVAAGIVTITVVAERTLVG